MAISEKHAIVAKALDTRLDIFKETTEYPYATMHGKLVAILTGLAYKMSDGEIESIVRQIKY